MPSRACETLLYPAVPHTFRLVRLPGEYHNMTHKRKIFRARSFMIDQFVWLITGQCVRAATQPTAQKHASVTTCTCRTKTWKPKTNFSTYRYDRGPSTARVVPVARYSACGIAWHRREQPAVGVCGVVCRIPLYCPCFRLEIQAL